MIVDALLMNQDASEQSAVSKSVLIVPAMYKYDKYCPNYVIIHCDYLKYHMPYLYNPKITCGKSPHIK